MALTVNVTKKEVSEVMLGMWYITVNLKCLDGAVEVINQDISVKYKTGQDIAAKQATFLEKLQAIIDEYKAEQVIFNHTKMTNLVTYLNTNLVG